MVLYRQGQVKAHLRELLRGGVEGRGGLLSLVSFRKSFSGIEPLSTAPSWAAVYCHHWPSASSHNTTTAAELVPDLMRCLHGQWLLRMLGRFRKQALSFMVSSAVHKLEASCCDYAKAERLRTGCRSHAGRRAKRAWPAGILQGNICYLSTHQCSVRWCRHSYQPLPHLAIYLARFPNVTDCAEDLLRQQRCTGRLLPDVSCPPFPPQMTAGTSDVIASADERRCRRGGLFLSMKNAPNEFISRKRALALILFQHENPWLSERV